MSEPSPRFTQGMATRRKVLSDQHVDVAVANTTRFTEDFQTLITESAWGSVWSNPTVTLRERSMITIALLAALGQDDELAMHVRATRNTGANMQDIKAALMHVAIYAGVPAANHGFKIAAETYAEMQATQLKEAPHA